MWNSSFSRIIRWMKVNEWFKLYFILFSTGSMFRMITYWWPRMKFSRHVVSRVIVLFCLKKKKKKARMVWSEACKFKRHDVNIQESRVFSFFLFMFVYDITFSRNLTTNNLHYKLLLASSFARCGLRARKEERKRKITRPNGPNKHWRRHSEF